MSRGLIGSRVAAAALIHGREFGTQGAPPRSLRGGVLVRWRRTTDPRHTLSQSKRSRRKRSQSPRSPGHRHSAPWPRGGCAVAAGSSPSPAFSPSCWCFGVGEAHGVRLIRLEELSSLPSPPGERLESAGNSASSVIRRERPSCLVRALTRRMGRGVGRWPSEVFLLLDDRRGHACQCREVGESPRQF
jgi:hypothetical protein